MKNSGYLFLLLLLPIGLWGQVLLPPIQNYKIFEYKAASKNWSLACDEEGELYVANNEGLLHYNGEEWTLYKLPHNTTIRSVASIEGRIYTGSYEEFGYWMKNAVGNLEYTSLTHLIRDHVFTSEEFWQILPYKDAILFRSFSGIYEYKDNAITVIDPPMVVSYMEVFRDKVLVAAGHERLYWLSGVELVPYGNHEVLDEKIVIDMDIIPEGLMIGTKLNGCYILSNGQLNPFNTGINTELKRFQLNQILRLSNGKIAFGTIKNGVYLYDPERDTYQVFNRESGLQNNTILSMLQVRDQLWLGLDNGIDRVQLNHPLTYFTDYSGVVGTVYDLAFYKGILYVGSNTGIYYFRENKLHFVEGSQGHVWDLEVIDGDLFCGHNTGTFRIEGDKLELISTIAGGYQIVSIPEGGASFLQGTYTGIAKYDRGKDGQWQARPVAGFPFPVKYLCFEDPETLWAAHPYKGFYRIKLNMKKDSVVIREDLNTQAPPNIYNIKLYNIKNQIVLQSAGEWYIYDPILGTIGAFKEFQAYTNKDLLYNDGAYYWFVNNENTKEVIQTDLKSDHLVLSDKQFQERLAPESGRIIKQNDSTYYFTLIDGFAKLDLSKLRKQQENLELYKPQLSGFRDEDVAYTLLDTAFLIPYKSAQDLQFKISSAKQIMPRYYYELRGAMEKSAYSNRGTIQFQNLPYGDYDLKISTVGTENQKSEPLKLSFQILAPWYLSAWSIAGYVLLLLALVFYLRWFNRRKLQKKHDNLIAQLHREQEEQLARLEKEKLAKEIRLKQKELASSTMNVARKNEMILELKNLLLMNKDKFHNQQRYRLFMKKLNSSMEDTEDWKRFEMNFKELHEDFFGNLLKRYPNLTPKDLKLCAYLKMNLSTKEIAPLMGITTRGVEIHRYRLRKKLQLEATQNISNFLITLR